jgi:hypothetical protein
MQLLVPSIALLSVRGLVLDRDSGQSQLLSRLPFKMDWVFRSQLVGLETKGGENVPIVSRVSAGVAEEECDAPIGQ